MCGSFLDKLANKKPSLKIDKERPRNEINWRHKYSGLDCDANNLILCNASIEEQSNIVRKHGSFSAPNERMCF